MAGNLYVRQFIKLADDERGRHVEAGQEPGIVDSVIAFSGASASLTLDTRTAFVELHADDVCHYVFGPTATTGNMRLPGDATVFKGVHHRPGQATVLAAIEGT